MHVGGSVDPFDKNSNLTNAVKDYIARYINSHFSVSFKDQEKLSEIIFDGAYHGRDHTEVGKKMENILGPQTDVFDLGLDATMRTLAFQNIYRQQQAGAHYYTWQTMEDTGVRSEHQKLNQKIFAYSPEYATDAYPYLSIYPGSEHLCRCVALPKFDNEF